MIMRCYKFRICRLSFNFYKTGHCTCQLKWTMDVLRPAVPRVFEFSAQCVGRVRHLQMTLTLVVCVFSVAADPLSIWHDVGHHGLIVVH